MIRIAILILSLFGIFDLSGQTCLDSIFITDGTGVWAIDDIQVGSTIDLSVSTCIDFTTQPYGAYDFYYIVSTDCCSDTSSKKFYNMDIGEVEPLDFTICDSDDPVILIDQFLTFVPGANATYQFTSSASGFNDNGMYQISTYTPIDSIGTYEATFTCTPMAPVGYTIHPDCVPVDYTFEIILDSCCPEPFVLTGVCLTN